MSSIDDKLKDICTQSQELGLATALTSLNGPKQTQVRILCEKLDQVSNLLLKNPGEYEKSLFHLYYANLLGFIFGTSSSCGWITFLNEKRPENHLENNKLSPGEKLLKLLSPGGSFFQVILLLQEDENYIYNLKVEYLPPALLNEDKREARPQVSNTLKDRLFEIPSEKIASQDWVVRFNAYELYIYSLLTYLLTQDCKNPISSKEGQQIYLALVKNVFSYILPLSSSEYEKPSYVPEHFKACSFISKDKNVSIPSFFMELFSEVWLIPSTKLTKSPSPYYEVISEDNQLLPGETGFNLIKVILAYLSKNFSILCPISSSDEPAFNILGTSLWRNIFEVLQPRVYHFLKSSISCRKLDPNYINLLDLWKSYLFPWGKDVDNDLWRTYVIYNFFFYKEILLEFLQRCLISERISQSLGRTSTLKSVESFYLDIITSIANDSTLKILREGESNLQYLPRQSLLHLDFSYDYLPLFSYTEVTQSEKIKQQLKDLLARFESSEFNCRHITASNKNYLIPELFKIFSDLANFQINHMSSVGANSKNNLQGAAPLDFIHTMKDYCARYFSKRSYQETTIFDKNLYLTIDQYKNIANHMTKSFWPSDPQPYDFSQTEPASTVIDSSQSLGSLYKRSFSVLQSSPISSHKYEPNDYSDNLLKRSKVPGAWSLIFTFQNLQISKLGNWYQQHTNNQKFRTYITNNEPITSEPHHSFAN